MRFKYLAPIPFLLASAPAWAEEAAAGKIDSGDTAWVLLCAALVLLMTPGLALFYGGMVRKKNVLGTMLQSFAAIAVISIQWALFGYSLAFGPDIGHIIGGWSWFGLNGVGPAPNPDYAPTVPHQAFMLFQMMFAVITPAVVSGAFAERFRFPAFLLFILLWATFVYDPLAHWVWAKDGWLRNLGVLDFAGGAVVEINSGVSALAAAIYIGRRRGYPQEPMPPHSLPLTLLGAGLLWFGWFGFNAGSALTTGAPATAAFMATHLAACAGTLGWLFAEWTHRGKPTMLGAVSGSITGLVAITPACGFVGPIPALFIGALAGVVCYGAVVMKFKMGYDDSLDVFGVHGVGGVVGMLCTGVFASVAVNPGAANGLLYGNPGLLGVQALAVLVTCLFTFAMTYGIMKLCDKVAGVRVGKDEELQGLDLTQHGESAYTM